MLILYTVTKEKKNSNKEEEKEFKIIKSEAFVIVYNVLFIHK